MDRSVTASSRNNTLPVILIASLIQGWSLYFLHEAIVNKQWPATDTSWLVALYTLAALAPLTVNLLAEHTRQFRFWALLSALAVCFFYFGWHQGGSVSQGPGYGSDLFAFAAELMILWLLALPFVQSRLASNSWRFRYALLFSAAWRNKLMLAEAALFTGLFWALLGVWQMLFHLLQIDFFQELFALPAFIYPVTAITFGLALHIIGSIERLTSLVLEQILNVLKWLAVLAALIMLLFSAALLPKIPAMLASGDRVIGAAWLLWLLAFVVLLWNAAFRDGAIEQPFPKMLGLALRLVSPLMIIIAATAVYALVVRSRQYGYTVERVWALIVAGIALVYAVGYSIAARGRGVWMAGMARVNVFAALTMITLIAAALTPLLSPYRLAADSQFARALQLPDQALAAGGNANNFSTSAFHYLRWSAGHYGQRKLQELSAISGIHDAARINQLARTALAMTADWSPPPVLNADKLIAAMPVYPAGRKLDASLSKGLIAEFDQADWPVVDPSAARQVAGLFIDLNDDGTEEFVLLQAGQGAVYRQQPDWKFINRFSVSIPAYCWSSLLEHLRKGEFSAQAPPWKLLAVGPIKFTVLQEPVVASCSQRAG